MEYYHPEEDRPAVFLGAGLGINDYGLGVSLEVPLSRSVSINGNLGIGGWGGKVGTSLNYYVPSARNNSELSLGYSYAGGMKNFETSMPVLPNGNQEDVIMDLNPVSTLNLVYTYNVRLGKLGKLGLSAGYAVCLTSNGYTVDSSHVLDTTGDAVMKMMQPGGLILGLRFMIGIR